MSDLIQRVRAMTQSGTADYTVANTTYWNDDQIQQALDWHRQERYYVPMPINYEVGAGATSISKDYKFAGDVERASVSDSAFVVRDGNGDVVGTALYSVNYDAGVVRFNDDTDGDDYYLDCRVYNLNRTAADICRQKVAHYSVAYDIASDQQSLKRSQLQQHFSELAVFYDTKAGARLAHRRRSDLVRR